MQGIFQKENTDKALKYGIYRHLPTYEKIIRNLVSFCHKKQLIVIMLGSLFIMASFSADLFGYDRYIPKASNVESIEIKPSEVNSYGYWGKTVQQHPLQAIMRKTASFYSLHLYLKKK